MQAPANRLSRQLTLSERQEVQFCSHITAGKNTSNLAEDWLSLNNNEC